VGPEPTPVGSKHTFAKFEQDFIQPQTKHRRGKVQGHSFDFVSVAAAVAPIDFGEDTSKCGIVALVAFTAAAASTILLVAVVFGSFNTSSSRGRCSGRRSSSRVTIIAATAAAAAAAIAVVNFFAAASGGEGAA
jgi:hypothetical protein